MEFGEIVLFKGVITKLECKENINLVLLKVKHFDNVNYVKEKVLEINKDLFDEKLSDLVVDCECFFGIRKKNVKVIEKMKEGYDSSLYNTLPAREWNAYKKEMVEGLVRFLKDDVIFIKVISNENGEEIEDLTLSSDNLDEVEINAIYKVWKRLNSDGIKSISRK